MRENRRDASSELRKLPQLERLASCLEASIPHPLKISVSRQLLDEIRARVLAGGEAPGIEEILRLAAERCAAASRGILTRVINATGVILHTNLGRAPLSDQAAAAAQAAAFGYTDLEYELGAGGRGSRYTKVSELLRAVTGAEEAIVVNNNAAALMLSIKALAAGGSVLVSRGEMIEIGGEFRLPEIIASAGAVLKEVGTTNRTRISDYEDAVDASTRAILKVHPSNYKVVGFASSADPGDLAELARRRGLAFVNDVGSGLLRRKIGGLELPWLADEPAVDEAVKQGADIVCFSGDKLVGGPQAGLIAGKRLALDAVRSLPMLRTARADKMTLASMGATLMAYRDGTEVALPIWRMALLPRDALESRSVGVISAAGDGPWKVRLVDTWSTPGGGSAPGAKIPTVAIEIEGTTMSADEIADAFRQGTPPIIVRIEDGHVIIDLRCVDESDDAVVARALEDL